MNELEFWRWNLTQLDRQLSGNPDLTVEWAPPADRLGCRSWGYTSSEGIFLDRDVVARWFRNRPARKAISRLMGLNFHEVAHVIFTPDHSLLAPLVGDRATPAQDAHAFNALEDQRIERLLIDRHPAARGSIVECVEAAISVTGDEAFLLLHGRDHVRSVFRETAGGAFRRRYGRRTYERLTGIIDNYVAIDNARAVRRMVDLAHQLTDLRVELGLAEATEDGQIALDFWDASEFDELDEFDWGEISA